MKKLLIILILMPLFVKAQTRLYMTTITPAITVTPNAGWDFGSPDVRMVTTYKTNATSATAASASTGTMPPKKVIITQFITPPLSAQTISGTFTGQLKASNATSSVTGPLFVYLRLINSDGSVASELGTLTTTNLTTTTTNRTLIALTLTSVSVSGGQRFVIELGWNNTAGSITTG